MKLKSFMYASVLVMTVGVAGCQNSGKKGDVALTSKIDSVSYSLGVLMGEGNKQQMKGAPGFDQLNKEIILAAFDKAFMGDSVQIKAEACNASVQKFFAEIAKVDGDKNQKDGEEFLATNSKKAGVVTLPSGLQYEIIKTGTGVKPKSTDQVKCHYHGTTIDGKVFDSSVDRGEPAVFPVDRVIPGWTEALQLMPIGSKWKLYIPSGLAYGEQAPSAEIKPNSTLIFEVELLEIVKQ